MTALTTSEQWRLYAAFSLMMSDPAVHGPETLTDVVEEIVENHMPEPVDVWALENRIKVLEHNVRAVYNFTRAQEDPVKYCCSGRCAETNWGGKDRLHLRSATCPTFNSTELTWYLRRAGAI